MMTISVCMATFNGMPYIKEQIDTIRTQLGAMDELIVSDDGSSDGTLEFLQTCGIPQLQIYTDNARKGPVGNFGHALGLAKGDILVLCDQDDVWLPGRLDLIRDTFGVRQVEPLCLIMGSERIDGEGNLLASSNLEFLHFRTGILKNLVRNSYMGCAMAFNKELKAIALPFPAYIPMHDSWLGMLGQGFGRTMVIDEPTFRYRVHGGNVSHRRQRLGKRLSQRLCLIVGLTLRITKILCQRIR